ncbi:hypothetical protein OPQ81_008453 [Rhizoctonia solani]|nr:hypothetical protein OPQ81_008453 [Rhizoctonia solani]
MPSPFKLTAPRNFIARDEIKKFLARSNVTRLALYCLDDYFQLTEVLKLAPQVQTLVIDGIRRAIGATHHYQASEPVPSRVSQISVTNQGWQWSWGSAWNLPTQSNHIIGEDEEVSELQHWLDSLYVVRSFSTPPPTWHNVRQLVKRHNVRRLTLWSYDTLYYAGGSYMEFVAPHDLHTVCPVVNVIPQGEPNPVEGWC